MEPSRQRPYLDSVRPNLFAKIIAVLSILRLFCIIYPGLNIIIENEFLCTEGIHVIVFLIGMFLAIECFLSILNFLFGLRLLKLRMDWWIPKLSFYSIFILISMSFSVLNAVLLFQMVRSVWTQYFAYFIQILHCVPTALLIAQTLIQGVYFVFYERVRNLLRGEIRDRLLHHLESQRQLNIVLILYILCTVVSILTTRQEDKNVLAKCVLYAVGAVVWRISGWISVETLRRELKSTMVVNTFVIRETFIEESNEEQLGSADVLQQIEEAEESEEEAFQLPRREESYDDKKELFVPSSLNQLPTSRENVINLVL